MRFSGKIIPSLYQCCGLALLLFCNVSLAADPSAISSMDYFGGSNNEQVNAITTDAQGNTYLTGWTKSAGLPGSDATGTTISGAMAQDAFVTKLNAVGNVIFTRYIGTGFSLFGDKVAGQAVIVSDNGTIYISGTLASNPAFQANTVGAYDKCDNGNVDAFIAVVDGSNAIENYPLKYLSCFGGSAADYATDMVLNSDGSVTLVGYTSSANFPTKSAFRATKDQFNSDAFIVRLSPSGQGADDLLFASYLGGDGADQAEAVSADASGNLYIVGTTNSSIPSGFLTENIVGSSDAFVARLNQSAAPSSGYDAPQYVRLLPNDDGGINCDTGADIAVDSQNERLYLTGRFGSQGAFIASMNTSNGHPVNTSIIGGALDANVCGVTVGRAIVLDSNGGGFIGGVTAADDLPAQQNAYSGSTDGFITRFDADLNPLYTYYLGGSMDDAVNAIQRSSSGYLQAAGKTNSTDWVIAGSSPQGGTDVLLTGLNPQVDLSIDAVSQIPVLVGGSRQFNLTLRNSGPDPAHDISFEISPPSDFPGDISLIQGSCDPTLTCTRSGIDLPAGTSIPLTVTVSSMQLGSWTLGYALTSPAYEQAPTNNQGDLALLFVDQLPPTIVVNDGSTGQVSGGGGSISGCLIILLSLVSLVRASLGACPRASL